MRALREGASVRRVQTPAVTAAANGLWEATRRADADAADTAAQGGDTPPETLVDATVVQPGVYGANARVLAAADSTLGTLLDVYA